MSRELPLDLPIVDELDAIEATLAGDPVEPRFAELAEMALLIRADRPEPTPEFTGRLDATIASGLEGLGPRARREAPAPAGGPTRRSRRSRLLFGGGLAAALAALAAVFAVATGSPGPSSSNRPTAETVTSSITAAAPAPSAPAAATGAAAKASPGRQVIQSAQLDLTAPPTHIEDVASELFSVVGAWHGFVESSHVSQTGGTDGSANFSLSIPSAHLADALAGLSKMRYATVGSRSDDTSDVTDQLAQDERRLGDARALRASLLSQLAKATTLGQINSLRGQLHDADSTITAAENTIASLRHRVSNSTVTVTVYAGSGQLAPVHHGLSIGRALHDAGHVLGRIAGVAVLVLAVMLPLAAVVLALWWLAGLLRGARRERALDRSV